MAVPSSPQAVCCSLPEPLTKNSGPTTKPPASLYGRRHSPPPDSPHQPPMRLTAGNTSCSPAAAPKTAQTRVTVMWRLHCLKPILICIVDFVGAHGRAPLQNQIPGPAVIQMIRV